MAGPRLPIAGMKSNFGPIRQPCLLDSMRPGEVRVLSRGEGPYKRSLKPGQVVNNIKSLAQARDLIVSTKVLTPRDPDSQLEVRLLQDRSAAALRSGG